MLPPDLALPLSLVAHELTINATKYHRLSTDDGVVSIRWTSFRGDLHLMWTETGGPSVSPPKRKGFGSVLIERAFPATAKARGRSDFRPEGVVFESRSKRNRSRIRQVLKIGLDAAVGLCDCKVLTVEDEPLLRMMAVDLVEDADLEVFEAGNPADAIVILATTPGIGILYTVSVDGPLLAAAGRDKWPRCFRNARSYDS